jgi:protein O-mannosyl-transferase
MSGLLSRRLAVIGLLLLTVVAFGRVLNCDFVNLDDGIYVTENPAVQAGLTARGFRWAWTTFHAGYWQPLTWLSLQLDAQLFRHDGRPDAYGFHQTNLLLHAANVLLLFGLLVSLTGRVDRSAVVAALFAVHPLRVESVAWVAERKDVLSTLFWILTLLAYVSYARRPAPGRYLLVTATYALGLLVKPMLVTLPCVLLLLDWWPLRRLAAGPAGDSSAREPVPAGAPASVWRLVAEKLPLLALAVAASVVTLRAQASAGAVPTIALLSVPDRLANAIRGYGGYLTGTFWPLSLSVFYPHPHSDWSAGPVVAAALVVAAVTVLVLWLRRFPYLAVGWLWFLGTLVPVIGLVQAGEQALADRFTYVPHIGLLVALVWGTADLLDYWRCPSTARVALALAVTGCLTVLTVIQIGNWTNSISLWQQALRVMPDNYFARANLGLVLLRKGDLKGAEEHYRASLQARPDAAESHYNLGIIFLRTDRAAEAADAFREELRLHPDFVNARYNLGMALARQARYAEAAEEYTRVLEVKPGDAETHLVLGVALAQAGKLDEAEHHFATAVELKPDYADARNNLGCSLLRRGATAEAIENFTAAVAANKQFALAYNNLGIAVGREHRWLEAAAAQLAALELQPRVVGYRCDLAYARYESGQRDAAAAEYQRAFQQDHDWATVASADARRLATTTDAAQRDVSRALELAAQACQATSRREPEFLDTLAAARAAAGQFEQAVAALREALALVPAEPDSQLTRALQEKILLYQHGKPGREGLEPGR